MCIFEGGLWKGITLNHGFKESELWLNKNSIDYGGKQECMLTSENSFPDHLNWKLLRNSMQLKGIFFLKCRHASYHIFVLLTWGYFFKGIYITYMWLIFLQQSEKLVDNSEATWHKLKGDLQVVFNVLPKDMQHLLLMNPERATLLQWHLSFTIVSCMPHNHKIWDWDLQLQDMVFILGQLLAYIIYGVKLIQNLLIFIPSWNWMTYIITIIVYNLLYNLHYKQHV